MYRPPWKKSTFRVAALRELKEESELIVREEDLKQAATIQFFFEESLVFECSVFLVHEWQGIPAETEEMALRWYAIDALPFTQMWAADAEWLPLILRGETIEARVVLSKDGSEVREFSYHPVTFNEEPRDEVIIKVS